MDPNEMTPTQYFVQKILNKQPIEPMDEVPLGPSLSDLLNTALGQRGIFVNLYNKRFKAGFPPQKDPICRASELTKGGIAPIILSRAPKLSLIHI